MRPSRCAIVRWRDLAVRGSVARLAGVGELRQQDGRGAVRDDPDPGGRGDAGVDDHPPGGLGEHGDQRGAVAQLAEHLGLLRRSAADSTVCRVTTNGWLQFLDQRQHVGAGLAAEDAVLVLDQHDVGAAAVQQRRHRDVVGADVLPDHRQHLGFRVGVVVADDRHDIDLQRRIDLQQRRAQVAGEGADAARPRRIGGNDCHSHGHCCDPDEHRDLP